MVEKHYFVAEPVDILTPKNIAFHSEIPCHSDGL